MTSTFEPGSFRADPASIVREMNSLLPDVLESRAGGDEMRRLGILLAQTPGSTARDALAFATTAATILGSILNKDDQTQALPKGELDALVQVGGYLVQAIRTLEAVTGETFYRNPDDSTP